MHWKLTPFEKRRMRRIALDHPCFDGRRPLLSKREMASAVARGCQKTGEQMIEEAMAELGLPYVPARKRRTLREALGDAAFVPGFRRTMVLGTIALLAVLFLTLTVPGRALAESMYSIIVEYRDGSLSFRNTAADPAYEKLDLSQTSSPVDTPEKLAAVSAVPVLLSEDEVISFEYRKDDISFFARTFYRTPEGKRYLVTQDYFSPGSLWGTSINAREQAEIPSEIRYSGKILLFAGVTTDGVAFLMGTIDDIPFSVRSSEMTLEELKSCMPRLTVRTKEAPQSAQGAQDAPAEKAAPRVARLSTRKNASAHAPAVHPAILDFAQVPEKLRTPQMLAAASRFPILICEDRLVNFNYQLDDSSLLITSRYLTEEGQGYLLLQTFLRQGTQWGSATPASAYTRIPSEIRYDGEIALYAGTTSEGTAFLFGYGDDFILTVMSEDMTLPELEALMPRIGTCGEDLRGVQETLAPTPPLDLSRIPEQMKTPQQLADASVFPILLSEDELSYFEYESDPDVVLYVWTGYRTPNGRQYNISQIFYTPDASWGSSIKAKDFTRIQSKILCDDKLTLYAGRSPDGAVFLTGFSGSYAFTVMSKDLTLAELEDIMPQMAVKAEEPDVLPDE